MNQSRTVFFVILFVLYSQDLFAVTETESIYYETCFVCHGADGSGNMPGVPDLAESVSLFEEDESVLVARIVAGIQRPGGIAMPPRGGNPALSDKQLLNVLRFVKKMVKASGGK